LHEPDAQSAEVWQWSPIPAAGLLPPHADAQSVLRQFTKFCNGVTPSGL
jgi:hypothetical protein